MATTAPEIGSHWRLSSGPLAGDSGTVVANRLPHLDGYVRVQVDGTDAQMTLRATDLHPYQEH